jgi:hypothetical protein
VALGYGSFDAGDIWSRSAVAKGIRQRVGFVLVSLPWKASLGSEAVFIDEATVTKREVVMEPGVEDGVRGREMKFLVVVTLVCGRKHMID